jgi:hypothetical protein
MRAWSAVGPRSLTVVDVPGGSCLTRPGRTVRIRGVAERADLPGTPFRAHCLHRPRDSGLHEIPWGGWRADMP